MGWIACLVCNRVNLVDRFSLHFLDTFHAVDLSGTKELYGVFQIWLYARSMP